MSFSLFWFIGIMWIIIIAIAAFLVTFVAPINLVIFNNRTDLYLTSIVQGLIAILVVLFLIISLSVLKKKFLQKKLKLT